jgi:hypothetical protein
MKECDDPHQLVIDWTAKVPASRRPREQPKPKPTEARKPKAATKRVVAVPLVPKPFPSAVAAVDFGEEDGPVVKPSADEGRAIAKTLATRLEEDLSEGEHEQFQFALASYVEDFGEQPAA